MTHINDDGSVTANAACEHEGWRPIETAPMNFDRCLFFTSKGIYRVDRFHEDYPPAEGRQRWREVPADRYTHWMPLPTPPISGRDGG